MAGEEPLPRVPGSFNPPSETIDILFLITAQDIKNAFPPLNSAPGPDGFTSRKLRAVPMPILRVLLNLLNLTRKVPVCLQGARTVFLPKKPEASAYSDFRPITMASVLMRLYHKILAHRLMESVDFDFRQRAFIPVDGCGENISILSAVLDEAKTRFRPLYLASVDLAKAFDRVSTEAILRGARLAGLSEGFLGYLEHLYRSSNTVLHFQNSEMLVQPTAGVRQGDPLSPLLFNLVLNEWLQGLDERITFVSGDLRVSAMAFADDLLIMATTPQGLQERLDSLMSFLVPRGLQINVTKSFTLALVPSKDKKVKVDTSKIFTVGGIALPTSDTATVWRYLGLQFSAMGRSAMPLERELAELLCKVSKAPLKPQQRLVILRFYLIPRLLHRLVLGPWSQKLLLRLDKMIRASMRRWLALPHDAPMAYFHADVSEGGLCVPSLRTAIPGMQIRRLEKLSQSSHPACRAALKTRLLKSLTQRAKAAARYRGKELFTKKAVSAFWTELLHHSVDGAALKNCRDAPYAQAWVRDGTRLLSGKQFIDLVKLRINAFPNLTRTKRGQGGASKSCRAGCLAPESLGHILQACHRTHSTRLQRHDGMVAYLAKRLEELEWDVAVEPRIETNRGTVEPDLVLKREGQSVIVDAQVVGTRLPLHEAHRHKVAKYSFPDLWNQIRVGPSDTPVVTSATVSYRGVWAKDSVAALHDLGLGRYDVKLMTVRALQGGGSVFPCSPKDDHRGDTGDDPQIMTVPGPVVPE